MKLHGRAALFIAFVLAAGCSHSATPEKTPGRYEDLVTLFKEWRTFQPAPLVEGVPDYGRDAMSAQQSGLTLFQQRLAALDVSAWTIPQQVDYHIVRAEMNGLDFDHRVLKPWANDPAFYTTFYMDESDQPAREGNYARGGVDAWRYTWPLDAASLAEISAGVKAIPALLIQARTNLTGDGKDLWTFGARELRAQSRDLGTFAAKLTDPALKDLLADVTRAKEATDAFATWVESQAASKSGPSGIGVENYDWYLKNVELLPYTWRDELTLMARELGRAHSALALEEARNSREKPAAPIANADEYAKRAQEAVTGYMAFLKDHDVLTVRDYMDGALRAKLGRFTPAPREFFGEIDHHDPEVMRTHGYHWFDKARMIHAPHASPIRRDALLYNIFITRTEGHATAWEELMLNAGMFDKRPRSRELIYILVAQRAARALGDLKMHARLSTLEEAAAFTSANTPRGWLSLQGNLVRGEQHLYLRQPAYGTSYLIGKIQIEKLIGERKNQLGNAFTFRKFMDEYDAAGLIPITLLRWELLGEMPEDVRTVLAK